MTSASVTRAGREAAPTPGRKRRTALALLAVAQLMLVLDVTVVNVALPDIGTSLHLTRSELPWAMTAYTVAFGGLMLVGGRAADRYGARRLTMTGLAVFISASLLSGLAAGPAALLAGRALQGAGAALLSPAALATVMTLFTGNDRARALGVWSALAGLGSALGVILGGVLTTEASWRWIFTINVPIGAALLIAVPLTVPAGHAGHAEATAAAGPGRPGLDIPGGLLVTTGTGAAIYGLINAGTSGWAAPSTLGAFALAVVAWAAFARVERRSASPLLEVGLLRRRPVAAGGFLMLIGTGLLVGTFFLASFSLQHADGYSALRVGLSFIPVAVATVAGAHTAGQVLVRVPARAVAVTGPALAAAGYGTAALWTGPAQAVTGMSVASLGIGCCFVTAFTASLADAKPAEGGLRSAIVNTFHELGGAAGVAVLSTIAGAALVAAHPAASAFRGAFTAGAACALAAAVIAAFLVPSVLRSADAGRPAH
ncbi:MAG TPA: MFS transporter [Trebonia sp.]|jgi:EmrB/QacA subfamily drug resistance transporter